MQSSWNVRPFGKRANAWNEPWATLLPGQGQRRDLDVCTANLDHVWGGNLTGRGEHHLHRQHDAQCPGTDGSQPPGSCLPLRCGDASGVDLQCSGVRSCDRICRRRFDGLSGPRCSKRSWPNPARSCDEPADGCELESDGQTKRCAIGLGRRTARTGRPQSNDNTCAGLERERGPNMQEVERTVGLAVPLDMKATPIPQPIRSRRTYRRVASARPVVWCVFSIVTRPLVVLRGRERLPLLGHPNSCHLRRPLEWSCTAGGHGRYRGHRVNDVAHATSP